MAELDLGVVTAEGLQCSLVGETQLLIGDHSLPLSYGRILLFGLNHVLIPIIDPWSSSLEDLLHYYIDCYSLGAEMSDYIGFGSADFYESICDTALAAASAYVEEQITSIDGTATTLAIHGEAHPQDTNADRKVDKLTNGLWEGAMNFGSVSSTLAKPDQRFTGQRMGIE
jgi:ribosomal protein S15P/S13E